MFLHKKALYNQILFRLIDPRQHGILLEEWQQRDLRAEPQEKLLATLQELGLGVDLKALKEKAVVIDTPEELADQWGKGMLPLDQDRLYLVLFELWRRLVPEKESLPMFCDELDHRIEVYRREGLTQEIQDSLSTLQLILEKNVDAGVSIANALPMVQSFCAHNLEHFLYIFLCERIEEGNVAYAKELLEGFHRFFSGTHFFDFLTCRIAIEENPEEGYRKLEKLIHWLHKHPLIELQFEILGFLSKTGNHTLFTELANQTLPLIKHEEDFMILSSFCMQHFDYLDLPTLAKRVEELINKKHEHSFPELLTQLQSIILQKVHS